MERSAAVAHPVRHAVSKYWWVLLLRGLASLALGVMAFAWPAITLRSLVLLYGAYCLVDGVSALLGGSGGSVFRSLFIGGLSIAAGIVTFIYPALTGMILLYLIAFWVILRGILEIVAAVQLRKVIEGEWFLILAGLASVLFGVLILAFPSAGALSIVWLLGIYALAFGALMVALSFKVKALA